MAKANELLERLDGAERRIDNAQRRSAAALEQSVAQMEDLTLELAELMAEAEKNHELLRRLEELLCGPTAVPQLDPRPALTLIAGGAEKEDDDG